MDALGILFTETIRIFLSTASLFLIMGGLAILFLIVTLFGVQGLVPLGSISDPLPAGKGKRRLRPLQGNAPVVSAAPTVRPPSANRLWHRRSEDQSPVPRIDIVLDRVLAANLGEPRILRRLTNGYQLRLVGCLECASEAPQLDDSGRAGCSRGLAQIEEACRAVFGNGARVHETSCRLQGRPTCDYEVLS